MQTILRGLSLGVIAASLLACSEVRIVPGDGGAGGEGPSQGGFDGTGAFDNVGGAGAFGTGGSGGAPPSVVPGCEVLELVGDPVVLNPMFQPEHVRMAQLAARRVGVAYVDRYAGQSLSAVLSQTLENPFDGWPPIVSGAVHHLDVELTNPPGPITSRQDGTFALGPGVRGIFAFNQRGVLAPFQDYWGHVFFQPDAGGGIEVVSWDDPRSYGLVHLPSVSSNTSSWGGSFSMSCGTVRAVLDEGPAFFSSGSEWFCDETPRVAFHRLVNGELVALGGFDLPLAPRQQALAARPGGYWYSASSWDGGIVVYALDGDGVPVGAPWIDDFTFGDSTPTFQAWRDGFVVSRRTEEGVSVYVSDGYNMTASAPQSVEVMSSLAQIAMVVGGDLDRSILFAYPTLDGLTMFRADCQTPIK